MFIKLLLGELSVEFSVFDSGWRDVFRGNSNYCMVIFKRRSVFNIAKGTGKRKVLRINS